MTAAQPAPTHLYPFDDNFFRDPYPTYTALHETGRTVHRVSLPDGNDAWLITGYEEASEALKDRRLVRNRRHAGADYQSEVLPQIVRSGNLHMEDGEIHTRLRRFMNWAFTPRRVAAMVPQIEQVTKELLDAMAADGGGDIMDGLAAPLPIAMTTGLLGVPHDQRGDFRYWSDELLGGEPPRARAATEELLAYVQRLIDLKRREPADDLISYWVSAKDNEGEPLTDQEMIGMTFFLLLGGYDTTVGQLGASVLALINHPEKAQQMRDDPEIIPDAVEELMRWDGSTHSGIRRFAAKDVEIGGESIGAGELVLISLGAANRCPMRFADPEVMQFEREENWQLGFGRGPHHCPGKELARYELRIALGELVRRFPNMRLAVPAEEIVWRPSYLIRVPRVLPVRC